MRKTVVTKHLLSALFPVCTFILFCSCGESKEQIKAEIKKELMQEINSPRVVAGNGRYFYGEPIMVGNSEYYIQHSISSCPKIRTGTKRGWIKIQNDANYFCPICMNNDLIDTFNSRYFPDKGK